MIPLLSSTVTPVGNGIGGITDAISCRVTHEINGVYELQMQYPMTGTHFSELTPGMIILADPGINDTRQPFRIYRITKPLNGIVTIYANHVMYDLSGIVVEPFTANTLSAALTAAMSAAVPGIGDFVLATNRTSNVPMVISAPRPMWRLLGGQEGSFLDVYGGEWDFNGQTATLKAQLGADNGVKIQYGHNLTELEQDMSLESTYGGVYPYWFDEESGTLVTLPEDYVTITGAESSRILCLDAGEKFQEQPTEAQLRSFANSYITSNSLGNSKTSWKVDFVMLSQSAEYADQTQLEEVALGDTVHVIYDEIGVNITARVVSTEYDVLLDRYTSMTIGRVKQNLAAIVVEQNNEIDALKKSLERTIVAQKLRGTDSVQAGANDTARAVLTGTGLDFYDAGGSAKGSYPANGITKQTAGILFGQVDNTSTSTAFTAQIPGVTSYYDGLAIMLKNGVVTSASGFTLDINGLGAKQSYTNLAAATADTTLFNVNYTMLFVYDSTRVAGGGWVCYRGYDANTNTIGYQVRTNSTTMPMKSNTVRYRLLFTSADGKKLVPATNSTLTNATGSRAVCQDPIDPHGAIWYYGTTAAVAADAMPAAANLWQQYVVTLGYSFNRTGAALTLTANAPVYIKCAPQSDGSAIIDSTTPYTQALPSTADGKIYIFLGIAASATTVEVNLHHPVYSYSNGAVRIWTGP